MLGFESIKFEKRKYITIVTFSWLLITIIVIQSQDPIWKEIIGFFFIFPIIFASSLGKIPSLTLSLFSSIVIGSQALNELSTFSSFAQLALFQILFINTVALVTTTMFEREQKAKQSYQKLFNNIPIGLFRMNSEGQLIKVNPTLIQLLNIDIESLGAISFADFFVNPDDFKELMKVNSDNDNLINIQALLKRENGENLWGRINCRSTENNDEVHSKMEYEGSIEDIDKMVMLYEEVKKLAIYDSLTGIYNRGHLHTLAKPILQQALRYHRPIAILLIDVDNFKTINDTYGHLVGDDVLREVAQCLLENLRNSDIAGRYGGDEFVILLPEQDYEAALVTAKRLNEFIGSKFISSGMETISITISIGIAQVDFVQDSEVVDLIRRADADMFEKKRAGRVK